MSCFTCIQDDFFMRYHRILWLLCNVLCDVFVYVLSVIMICHLHNNFRTIRFRLFLSQTYNSLQFSVDAYCDCTLPLRILFRF